MLFLVVIAVAAAATYYGIGMVNHHRDKPEVKINIEKPPVITLLSEEKKVILYLPEQTRGGVDLTQVTRTTKAKGSILDAAVNALLATNKEKGIVQDLIPVGTKLLSPITIKKTCCDGKLEQGVLWTTSQAAPIRRR